MKKKVIVREAFDLDQGIVSTFLTMFSDPRKVVTNPDKFTRPWKYATYVISISCLFTWFVIHAWVDVQDDASFWLVPRRMLDLLTGYQSFYENTQPLKRLVLGSAAFYVGFLIFFFNQRKQINFVAMCLYMLGHSVFLVFLAQSATVLVVGDWNHNAVPTVAAMVHIPYLTYASVRILGANQWSHVFKGVGVLVIFFTLYNAASTRTIHALYYKVLHRKSMLFRTSPGESVAYVERPTGRGEATPRTVTFKHELMFDSLNIVADCAHSNKGEIAKITMSCLFKSNPRWTKVIFEKVSRYSPDPKQVFVKLDSVLKTVFVIYRIANDSNATVQITSLDIVTGRTNFTASFQPPSDDLHLEDVAMDSLQLFVCGSTQFKSGNYDLGLIAAIDKRTGHITLHHFGSTSFASWTSFEHINLTSTNVELTVKHDYKWLFLFTHKERSVWVINKQNISG